MIEKSADITDAVHSPCSWHLVNHSHLRICGDALAIKIQFETAAAVRREGKGNVVYCSVSNLLMKGIDFVNEIRDSIILFNGLLA